MNTLTYHFLRMPFRKKYFVPFLFNFCLAALAVFFSRPLNHLLDVSLVQPIIGEFANTLFTGIILILFSVGLACWLYIYGNPAFLRRLGILTACFYALMLSCSYWRWQHSVLIPLLRNWDFVVLALIIPAIATVAKRQTETALPAGDGFLEEKAVENLSEDSFGRAKLAQEIAQRISLTANRNAFAIGILGEYGSGKTSFINLIKSQLDPQVTTVLDYNPWTADGAANIQKDFFDLLAARIYEIDPKISGLITNYARKLRRIDSGMEQLIRKIDLLGGLFHRDSYLDDYASINRLLKQAGRKVVITIDDVDRLYKDEIMEVLRLIRNTADFTNIFYLVAYERSYINQAIKSVNANAASSFLDKIIQLEIPLPKRESEDLLSLLENGLTQFVSAADMQTFREHIIKSGFKIQHYTNYNGVFRQVRDVIKFINGFKITYKLLGDETFFDNLFVLELLKFRFPEIYDRLYENRNEFISLHHRRAEHEQFYELKTIKDKNDERLAAEDKLRTEGYTDNDVRLIFGLISNMFFSFNRSKTARNAIRYPMFFERYFRYRLSGKDISENAFQSAWQGGFNQMKLFIDDARGRDLLNAVANRLFQIKTRDRNSYEQQIKCLFYIGELFVNGPKVEVFDLDSLTNLMWNYEGQAANRYYQGDSGQLVSFFTSLFSNADFPYIFHNRLLSDIIWDKKDVGVSRAILVAAQVNYLTSYIERAGITRDLVFMFWRTRYKTSEPVPEKPGYFYQKEYFEPETTAIMKAAIIQYDPFWFIKYTIKFERTVRNLAVIDETILKMFSTPAELRKITAESALLDAGVKEEYLAFFDQCEVQNFNSWITFEFHTALRPEQTDWDEY